MLPVNRPKGQARSYYDRLSGIYNWLTASEQALIHKGVTALNPAPGETILELGCGTGTGLQKIGQEMHGQGQALGVDLSLKMLKKSQQRMDSVITPWLLLESDAGHIPVKADTVDGVYCAFTLELFSHADMIATLNEIHRVLVPEGRLVVVALSREPHNLMTRLYEFGHRVFPVALDCRPIPTEAILAEAGFAPKATQKFMNWGLPVDIILANG